MPLLPMSIEPRNGHSFPAATLIRRMLVLPAVDPVGLPGRMLLHTEAVEPCLGLSGMAGAYRFTVGGEAQPLTPLMSLLAC